MFNLLKFYAAVENVTVSFYYVFILMFLLYEIELITPGDIIRLYNLGLALILSFTKRIWLSFRILIDSKVSQFEEAGFINSPILMFVSSVIEAAAIVVVALKIILPLSSPWGNEPEIVYVAKELTKEVDLLIWIPSLMGLSLCCWSRVIVVEK